MLSRQQSNVWVCLDPLSIYDMVPQKSVDCEGGVFLLEFSSQIQLARRGALPIGINPFWPESPSMLYILGFVLFIFDVYYLGYLDQIKLVSSSIKVVQNRFRDVNPEIAREIQTPYTVWNGWVEQKS